jgi:hypothetical protein
VNSSQATAVAVAAAGIVLMLLFPPYDSMAIGRGAPTFDAYYFVFDRQYNKTINSDLLFLQLGWVLLNAAAGWLLLRNYSPERAVMSRRTAVILFCVANLALILLFPPFENYASSARFSGTYFDSFYFLFGDKWQRRMYVPLLYLEVLFVLVNTAVLWLLFRDPENIAEQD